MSGLNTWTARLSDCVIFVTAETVDQAAQQVAMQTGHIVANVELVPLPTHHRHVRLISTRDGEDLTIYKRACESIASQMVYRKVTGLEIAKMQLGEK